MAIVYFPSVHIFRLLSYNKQLGGVKERKDNVYKYADTRGK